MLSKPIRAFATVAALAAAAALTNAMLSSAAATLDIYFIDVEGGQSTLIATPAGESLLIDTGWAGNGGRDARRIVAAIHDAGLQHIDYLLITHFHSDHEGGIVDLAPLMPIRTFIDHGDLDPRDVNGTSSNPGDVHRTYLKLRSSSAHLEPKPGDRLPLEGVQVVFVATARQTIAKAVSGTSLSNPSCTPPFPPPMDDGENPRSTGFHLAFGDFRFVDLGDLSGPPLNSLVCPANKLGIVDAYLLPHHGGKDVIHPSLVAALQPRVAILNNGETKGGDAETFAMLHGVRGLDDVWQLHRSRNQGARNFPEERIANLDETTGHWLKLSASMDGSFSVTNGRTGASKTYPKRSSISR